MFCRSAYRCRNISRCSDNDTFCFGLVRYRKLSRCSSYALQNRRRRLETPKSPHRVVALFDASMILLHPVIQVAIRAVYYFTSEYPAYGSWIGNMAICRYSLGTDPVTSLACLKKHLAATISRRLESRESARLPSRSMARYKYLHLPLTLR